MMPDHSVSKNSNKAHYDIFLAIILFAVVLFLALSLADNSCYWGDDFAAYITQGIAIAEGRLDEQAYLNKQMHPSTLPPDMDDDRLFYVWGYPLLLALVYNIVGFDRLGYSSIIYYKLPSILALAMLAVLVFLFLRRRFGRSLSFIAALLFCCCTEFFNFIHTLYSDMVFLLLAAASLLMCEIFLEEERRNRRLAKAALFGLVLWYMYEVRLNGVSIVLACALAHIVFLLEKRRQLRTRWWFGEIAPYAVFAVLVLFSQWLIATPTSNTSDLGHGLSLPLFFANLTAYFRLIWHWFGLLWNSLLINPLYSIVHRIAPVSFESFYALRSLFVGASCVLLLLGLLLDGGGKNLYLSVLLVVYIITASTLPYSQGLRYIYPLLPLVLMFSCYGLVRIGRIIPAAWVSCRSLKPVAAAVYLLVCFFIVYPHLSDIHNGNKGIAEETVIASSSDIYMQNAYSDAAIEAYNFIQSETESDCTIAFFAPRALYLNTQRLAVRPGVNGHSIHEADYFLEYLSVGHFPPDQPSETYEEIIFENSQFRLYRLWDEK